MYKIDNILDINIQFLVCCVVYIVIYKSFSNIYTDV